MNRPIFTRREIVCITIVFLLALGAAWTFGQTVLWMNRLHGWNIDCPANFPISMLALKLPGVHASPWTLAAAASVLVMFGLMLRNLRRVTAGAAPILLAGFVLVLGANLIQGPTYGLVHPQDDSLQYYHDAVQITSVGKFLREFEHRQPTLGCHSRTHPPGAVLLFYAIARTVGRPAAVSVAMAALAVVLCGGFFYGILAKEVDHDTCCYATFLFLLIPSVQIYCCATLDAVVAGCFLAVVCFFKHPSRAVCIIGSMVGMFCASFLTFGACFLVPVMVGFEWITRRTLARSAVVIAGVTTKYVILYLISGFNYFGSFQIASALENPGGFMLFAEPANYLFTRLENVCEILVFFGPFLLVLFVRGMKTMLRESSEPRGLSPRKTLPQNKPGGSPAVLLKCLTALGIATLAAMFLTGAFRTGETARACLFIVPYLMFPVAVYLDRCSYRERDKTVLLWLVFGQTMVMQTFGGYYW